MATLGGEGLAVKAWGRTSLTLHGQVEGKAGVEASRGAALSRPEPAAGAASAQQGGASKQRVREAGWVRGREGGEGGAATPQGDASLPAPCPSLTLPCLPCLTTTPCTALPCPPCPATPVSTTQRSRACSRTPARMHCLPRTRA